MSAASKRARERFAQFPRSIGRYQISGELGRGGMGIVYGAHDPRLDRRVALKMIPLEATRASDGPERIARFVREMRAVSEIFHENVVAIFDAGVLPSESGDQFYYVMEWVEGESLEHRIARHGALDRSSGLAIAASIARGLIAAHARGCVHRDLKPGNVLLPDTGGVKVADFGLCKLRADLEPITRPGTILGSPNYLAPEQVLRTEVGPATDLFALGVVLIRILTGIEPFASDSMARHLQRVISDVPDGLGNLDRDVRQLVRSLVEKNPRDRPDRLEEIAFELERLSQVAPPALRFFAGPRAVLAGTVVGLGTALILGGAVSQGTAETPIGQRVLDSHSVLSSQQHQRLDERLALFSEESGIDARFVALSPPSGITLEAFASERFEAWQAGGAGGDGRGVLFLFDPAEKRLRIDVGYGLETILPDPLLGHLIEEHARYLFESDDPSFALVLVMRMLQDHLRNTQLAGEFDPNFAPSPLGFRHASGGAGASGNVELSSIGDFYAAANSPKLADMGPGESPQAAYRSFLSWLDADVYRPNMLLFTPESRSFLESWPMTPAYLEHLYLRESIQEMAFLERGDRAIVYCKTSPFVSPHFLRRGASGWQIDIVTEVAEVVSIVGASHSWSLRSMRSDFLRPFADALVTVSGYIRIDTGDNRPIEPYRSS